MTHPLLVVRPGVRLGFLPEVSIPSVQDGFVAVFARWMDHRTPAELRSLRNFRPLLKAMDVAEREYQGLDLVARNCVVISLRESLAGVPVHVITANEYLVERDLRELDPRRAVPVRVNSAFNLFTEGVVILDSNLRN